VDHDNLYKSSDGAALRFFEEPKKNNFASDQHGRPIFDKCLMVEVITPGSRESIPVFELERIFAEETGITQPRRNPKYAQYEEQIKAFRSGRKSLELQGTPLSAWPALDVAQVASCEHAGIFTVDALAALPDSRFSALGPGARDLVVKAQAFLSAASGAAPSQALAVENEHLKTENERLTGEVAALSQRLSTAEANLAAAQTGSTPPPPPPPPPPPALKAGKAGKSELDPII
jgi:hypothetical protein